MPRGPATVGELAVLAPDTAWQRLSVGPGAKGERFYDWALIDAEPTPNGYRWALIRHQRTTGGLAFYRCYAPRTVPLKRLVAVAGRRWAVEESFQQGKGPAPGWTSTRCARGAHGTDGACSRFSPTPSSRCARPSKPARAQPRAG